MIQSLLPVLMPMIKKGLPKVEPALMAFLAKFPKQENEQGITMLLDIDDNMIFVTVVAINSRNEIIRVIRRDRITKFIENLLNNLNNGVAKSKT
jgi:hypothetical protein